MLNLLHKKKLSWVKALYYHIPSIFLSISRFFRKAALASRQLPRKLGPSKWCKLVPMRSAPNCEIIYTKEGREEALIFPKIHELTCGGKIFVKMHDVNIFCLSNVSFVMDSDFVRVEDGLVSNDKLFRKEYEFARPGDRDLNDMSGRSCRINTYPKKKKFETVFHITGPYFRHWAHFLAQFYPKLDYLSVLPKDESVSIVIPTGIDPHIKYLIENVVKKYKNINVTEVGADEELYCKKLYYPQIDTYLSDIGIISTPLHIQISDSTVRFWTSSTANLRPIKSNQQRKLYIGRSGSRGMTNGEELFRRFKLMGFEEVVPHQLDILEKIKTFSEAKIIVGPLSSGFINAIFCQPKTKILGFSNSVRHDDMLLTKLAKFNDFDLTIFTGSQVDSGDPNSRFSVDLVALDKFVAESAYFDIDDPVPIM